MSDPSAPDGALRRLIAEKFRELDSDADSYLDALRRLTDCGRFGTAAAHECRLARRARKLIRTANAIRDVAGKAPKRIIPSSVEGDMERFIAIVRAQLKSWGWLFILKPDGKARIKAKLKAYRRKRKIPFLRSALAWRKLPNLDRNTNADKARDAAEALKLKPLRLPAGATAEMAERRTLELTRAWFTSPALGPSLPSVTPDDRLMLGVIGDALRVHANRLAEPQSGAKETRETTGHETKTGLAGASPTSTQALPAAPAPDTPPPSPATQSASEAVKGTGVSRGGSFESQALVLMHEDIKAGRIINVTKIANEVGCSRGNLYRYKSIKALVMLQRREPRAKGKKDRKTGHIEAWSDEE